MDTTEKSSRLCIAHEEENIAIILSDVVGTPHNILVIFVDMLFKGYDENGLDIIEMLRVKVNECRKFATDKDVLLVLHTSFSNPAIQKAAIEAGADLLLTKNTDGGSNHDLGGSGAGSILLYTAYLIFQKNLINYCLKNMRSIKGGRLDAYRTIFSSVMKSYQIMPGLREKHHDFLEYVEAKSLLSQEGYREKKDELNMTLNLIEDKYLL